MRTFLLLGAFSFVVVACSNDSFGGDDASTNDGVANDVIVFAFIFAFAILRRD